MALKSLRDIKYFFMWLADVFRTWFTPYHYDDENDEEEAKPKPKAKKPAPKKQAEAEQAAYEAASPYDESAKEGSVAYQDTPDVSEILAFRGPVNKSALCSILGKTMDEIDLELIQMAESATAEEMDDGRYVLNDSERRHVLRTDVRMSEWLSGFQSSNFENEVLDVIEQVCRQLPVKIVPGKNLAIHIKQQKWMVWQSRQEQCRVRLFGTITPEQWEQLSEVDRRARRFRSKKAHRWDSRDSVNFRWRLGADTLAIESIFIEAGREFSKRVRRRRRGAGRQSRSKSEKSPSTT